MTKANVKITAQNQTDRAFAAVNKNVKNITGNLLSAKGAFTGFIGVAAVSRLADMAKESIEFADAIAKTADKLGVSTDALQEMRFAAERTGVEQRTLDTAIQRFSRRLGEAANGTGVLKGVLEKYNIAIRNSDGSTRSTMEVLNEYADAIKGANSQQERLTMASSAFDMEGVKLVNTLKNGSVGLSQLRKEARKLGVVLDEDLIRKSEIANDKWEKLTSQIGVGFRRAIISTMDVFVDLRNNDEKLNDALNRKGELLQRLNDAVTSNSKRERARASFIRKEISENDRLIKSLESLKKAREEGSDQVSNGADIAELNAIADNARRRDRALAIMNEQQKSAELIKIKQEEANQRRFIDAKIALDKQVMEEQSAEQAKQAAAQRLQNTSEILANLSTLTASTNKRMFRIGKASAIASTIVNTSAAAMKAWKQLGAFGGPAAAAIIAQGAVQLQRIRSQKFSGAREHGGPVISGRSYLVGERGPELFTPNGSGRIVNNKTVTNAPSITYAPVIMAQDTQSFEDRQAETFETTWNMFIERMNQEGLSFSS